MTTHAFSIHAEHATKILEAMGIDHTKVRYVKLEMGVDMVTTIHVEYLMETGKMEDLSNLMKKYVIQLTEIQED